MVKVVNSKNYSLKTITNGNFGNPRDQGGLGTCFANVEIAGCKGNCVQILLERIALNLTQLDACKNYSA